MWWVGGKSEFQNKQEWKWSHRGLSNRWGEAETKTESYGSQRGSKGGKGEAQLWLVQFDKVQQQDMEDEEDSKYKHAQYEIYILLLKTDPLYQYPESWHINDYYNLVT